MTRQEIDNRYVNLHSEVWALLPWYVNGTLTDQEIAAVVALLLGHEPLLSPYEVLEILRASVQPAATPGGAAHPAIGIIDACAALTKLTGAPACP